MQLAYRVLRLYLVLHSLRAAGSAGNASGCTGVLVKLLVGLCSNEITGLVVDILSSRPGLLGVRLGGL